MREVLDARDELAPRLPDGYTAPHLQRSQTVRRMLDDEKLTPEEESALEATIGSSIEQIRADFRTNEDDDAAELEDQDAATIVCSTMVSAKGLSAEHVFIVGFNDGQFPRDANGITEYEVCCLIVALSRTRQQCHLVSCGRWKGRPLQQSRFLNWLDVPIENRRRDAAYWKANPV